MREAVIAVPGHLPIYTNLNTFTLGGSTAASATNVSTMTDPVHIQESNIETLQAANTINEALFRSDGGPIPGTGICRSVAVTDNARTVVFTPEAGSVYQLISASVIADTSPAATISYYMYYQLDDQDGVAKLVYTGSTSSSSSEVDLEDFFEQKTAQLIDENCQVQVKVNSMGSASSYDFKFYAIRIR